MQLSHSIAHFPSTPRKSLYARVWLGKQNIGDVFLSISNTATFLLYTTFQHQDTHPRVGVRAPILMAVYNFMSIAG